MSTFQRNKKMSSKKEPMLNRTSASPSNESSIPHNHSRNDPSFSRNNATQKQHQHTAQIQNRNQNKLNSSINSPTLRTPPRHRLSPAKNNSHSNNNSIHSNAMKSSGSVSNTTFATTPTTTDTSESSSPEELTLFVQTLLEQMQSKFNTMGDSIIGRIDEMGNRIDELEKSIGDLMEQAGMDQNDHPNPHGLIMSPSHPRSVQEHSIDGETSE